MIIIAACFVLFLILLSEILDRIIFGAFISKSDTPDIDRKLNTHCFKTKGMIHFTHHDFYSKKWGILARWYIYDHGDQTQVPFWSDAHKLITRKYKSMPFWK